MPPRGVAARPDRHDLQSNYPRCGRWPGRLRPERGGRVRPKRCRRGSAGAPRRHRRRAAPRRRHCSFDRCQAAADGVKPSEAGAGRGSVNALPAATSRANDPLASRREAVEGAVDRIELRSSADQVFAAFERAGVTRDEIIARGRQLGGKALPRVPEFV